jgi:hypothetical protein
MNNGTTAEVAIPLQRQSGWFVRLLKRLLLTQVGKRFAFAFGLRGFNRVLEQHLKFMGKYEGQKLGNNDQVLTHSDNEVIPEGESWLYRLMSPQFVYNSRVDKGAAQQASLMSGATLGGITSPLPGKYIALSTSSLTPAKGDTTLTGETAVAGIARAVGTVQNYVAPSALDGAASYDVYNQFTLTGTGTTVVSTALFDAVSTGNMFAEVNFGTSAAMATNDILQVTWTVNI